MGRLPSQAPTSTMTDQLVPAETRLITALGKAVRGPQRNGLFALWLVVRVCDGLLPPDALSPRAHRKRLESLVRRLSSLSLPPALRRLLLTSIRHLPEGTAAAAVATLGDLRDSVPDQQLGSEAEQALSMAVRAAKALLRDPEPAPVTEVGV